MKRSSFKDFQRALQSTMARRWGMWGASASGDHPLLTRDNTTDNAWSNAFWSKAATADDKEDIYLLGTDSDNALLLGGEAVVPMATTETFYLNSLTGTPNQTILLAMFPMKITKIQCKFSAANGATLTGQVTKEVGVQAPAGGSTVMSNTFNLNGTANTQQSATLADYSSTSDPTRDKIFLNTGDRLSFKFSGAVTSLAGLAVTVSYIPGAKGHVAYYRMSANASIATQFFFLANRPHTIRAISMIWGTAATDAGAVTLDVTKDVSTNAPGAGSSVLSAAQSVKTAANTVNAQTLNTTASRLQMAAGDRLSVKTTGTLTALANVVIAVWFQPVAGRKEVNFNILANGSQATQPFFVADIDYEIVDFSEVHSVAGTDGGAVNIALTIDGGGVLTTAPGSGLVAQTDNSNAGFNAKGTANTVQVATLATLSKRILPAGAYLSALYAGTLTSLAGVCMTVSLRPRG